MTMLKVIEVLAESDKSWEDAAQQAVSKTVKTVHNVKSIYIENFEATVDNGKLKKFRVNGQDLVPARPTARHRVSGKPISTS